MLRAEAASNAIARRLPRLHGDYPTSLKHLAFWHCMPRPCGDVPLARAEKKCLATSAPPLWGLTARHTPEKGLTRLFPAYAGMSRALPGRHNDIGRVPRPCGDVPQQIVVAGEMCGSAPLARGCPGHEDDHTLPLNMALTLVGMFLTAFRIGIDVLCAPPPWGSTKGWPPPEGARKRSPPPWGLPLLSAAVRVPRLCGDCPSQSACRAGAPKQPRRSWG